MTRLYKNLWMIGFHLKKMQRSNRMLFWLVIISTMISTFGIFFFSGYIASNYDMTLEGSGDELAIRQEFKKNESDELYKGLEEVTSDGVLDIICTNSDVDKDEEFWIMGEYHKNYDERMQSGRMVELNETEPYVVVEDFSIYEMEFEDTPIGEYIDINGSRYEIIGVCSLTTEREAMVPVAYYLNHYDTDYITITFSEKMTSDKKEKIEDKLKKYGVQNMEWVNPAKPWDDSGFWVNFVQVALIFVIIGINVYILVQYMLHKNKRNYCIYSICGGTENEIMGIVFGQVFVHLLIGTIFGTILAFILFQVMKPMDLLYLDDWHIYIVVYLLVVLMYAVLAWSIQCKTLKNLEIYQIEE